MWMCRSEMFTLNRDLYGTIAIKLVLYVVTEKPKLRKPKETLPGVIFY